MASRPTLVTQIRGLGLPDRVVRAIEELQSAVRTGSFALSGEALAQVEDLIANGGSGSGGGSGGDTVVESPDLTPPPALEGFTADGGYGIVFLAWTPNRDRRYGYAEIWRSSTNNIGTAVQIGTSAGSIYVDEVQSAGTFYYWVRAVNKWDISIKSAYTPDGTTGVAAASAPDVPYLLDALSGAISESELATSLGDRIDLIDAGSGTPGSVDARILSETSARTAGDTALATSISALAVSSDSGFDWAKIWYFDSTVEGWTSNGGSPTVTAGLLRAYDHATDPQLISPASLAIDADAYVQVKARVKKVGSPTWEGRLYWKRNGDATWDIGRSVTVAEPSWSGGFGTVVFDPTWDSTIAQIRLDLGTSSDGTDRHELDWAAVGRSAPGASVAMVVDVEQTRIGYCELGGLATDHTNRADCETAGGTWNVGLPLATAVRQVSIDDGTDTLALEARFVAQRTTDDGLLGQYTVKIDADGRVSGFGLASTVPLGGVGTSEFAVRADKFYIAEPGGVTIGTAPFVVLTTPTVIDGDTIPPGTYIADAYIRNAVITGAKIKAATITDANIASLNAGKITMDSLVGRLAQIVTGDFQTIFAGKAFLQEANIVNGAISNAKIGNFIESTNYGPTTGWRLDKAGVGAGQAIFRNLVVTDVNGNVVLASGSGIPWNQIAGAKTFADTFTNIGKWANAEATTPEIVIAEVTDAVSGNTVLRLGNGAGNDYAYMVCDRPIPFDASALYRVRARVRRPSGIGTLYLGFVGVGQDGLMVNLAGANSLANQHFYGAAGASPGTGWTIFEGYFRGHGLNGNNGTADAPLGVHPAVRWMKPLIAANFNSLPGITEIDEFSIDIVDGAIATLDRISVSNASTYIENGAIGNLQIGSQIYSNDWVSSGGTAGWIIDKSGSAVFRGNVTISGLIEASLMVSSDGQRWLDLRDSTPSGYILKTPNAKILDDGSTQFNNQVGSGTVTVNEDLSPGTDGRIVKRLVIDTGIATDLYNSPAVFQPAVKVGGWAFLSGITGALVAVTEFRTFVRVGIRQPQYPINSGTQLSDVDPSLSGSVIIDVEVEWVPLIPEAVSPHLQYLAWKIYRIT